MAAVGAMKTISRPSLIAKEFVKNRKSRTARFATWVQRAVFVMYGINGFTTMLRQESAYPSLMVVVKATRTTSGPCLIAKRLAKNREADLNHR